MEVVGSTFMEYLQKKHGKKVLAPHKQFTNIVITKTFGILPFLSDSRTSNEWHIFEKFKQLTNSSPKTQIFTKEYTFCNVVKESVGHLLVTCLVVCKI